VLIIYNKDDIYPGIIRVSISYLLLSVSIHFRGSDKTVYAKWSACTSKGLGSYQLTQLAKVLETFSEHIQVEFNKAQPLLKVVVALPSLLFCGCSLRGKVLVCDVPFAIEI
jgi:hypothetical protein